MTSKENDRRVHAQCGTVNGKLPAIKDYTLYIGNDDLDSGNVQSYGVYEEYGSKDYYKNAATMQQNCFTDPYEDQGIHMISASFPIVYNDKTQGVILVDINIDSFSSLRSSDFRYSSMYVDVLNSDSMMIYDSESDEYVGTYLKDLISEKQYAKIQAGIDTGKIFSVSTKKDDVAMLTLAVIIVISRRLIVKYLKPIGGVVEVANQLAAGGSGHGYHQ